MEGASASTTRRRCSAVSEVRVNVRVFEGHTIAGSKSSVLGSAPLAKGRSENLERRPRHHVRKANRIPVGISFRGKSSATHAQPLGAKECAVAVAVLVTGSGGYAEENHAAVIPDHWYCNIHCCPCYSGTEEVGGLGGLVSITVPPPSRRARTPIHFCRSPSLCSCPCQNPEACHSPWETSR